MRIRSLHVVAIALAALTVYLFVSAPAPLPDGKPSASATLPVQVLFDVLAMEQAAARSIYTTEIVGPGLKLGLNFSEEWKKPEVEAGPLPALFLREVSTRLQSSLSEVGLFLGSDFPIAPVNKFSGVQLKHFEEIKKTGSPEYFKDEGSGLYTAMYLDPAGSPACVSCHNLHPDSPKKDWVLNDPMGATTWLYPRGEVSAEEVLGRLDILRRSVRESYETYLERAKGFTAKPVQIGDKWPKEGAYLPDADHFMEAVSSRASVRTLQTLLNTTGDKHGVATQ